jgi:hypothetical protein
LYKSAGSPIKYEYVSWRPTNYCTRKFPAHGPEVRRERRIGGEILTCRFSSRAIIASKESVSSTRTRAILSCSIGLLSNSDWSQAAFCGLPVMPFISRVSFWRRAGSRLLGQEVHPISQNGKFAIRKSYGACNCNEKRKRTRCNRRPRGWTGRDMSVQVKRVFIMSITKISNRRLLQAETRSSTKGGLTPSWRACCSLAGVKTGCGSIQSPTAHGGDDKYWRVGQGKCVLSQHGENLGLAILVAALGRRKSTEDSSEMVASGAGIGAGRGSQSLSNKRGATNMHGGRDRSQ